MKIKQNISLKNKNWFQTGGCAKFYCEPTNESEFQKALVFAKKNNVKVFVLGSGANILISDDGFDGLVIKPLLTKIEIKENLITAYAGTQMNNLIDFSLNNNLTGLEEFAGIPGTIGGSVFINLHYFNFLLSDFLVNAKVIEKKTGLIKTVEKKWFNFGYDQSKLFEKEYFLVRATFRLKKVNPIKASYAKGKRDERIRQRKYRYPISNTCGSFFRNFHENEVSLKINNKKMIFIAYYLDKLGIKGNLSVGKAAISYKHANMIVTQNGATSTDVIKLSLKIQQLVFKNFGIIPIPECQLIGFHDWPLLKQITKKLVPPRNLKPHHSRSFDDIQPSI